MIWYAFLFAVKYSHGNGIEKVDEDTYGCIGFQHIDKPWKERSIFDVQLLVPMSSTLNYFECEVTRSLETDADSLISVGIGPWSDNSHTHRYLKSKFCNAKFRVIIGDVSYAQNQKVIDDSIYTCTAGDKIGCGVDFDIDHPSGFVHVFFTKNGKQVGDLIRYKMPPFEMCPVVEMTKKGQRIHFLQHHYRPSLLCVSNPSMDCNERWVLMFSLG